MRNYKSLIGWVFVLLLLVGLHLISSENKPTKAPVAEIKPVPEKTMAEKTPSPNLEAYMAKWSSKTNNNVGAEK